MKVSKQLWLNALTVGHHRDADLTFLLMATRQESREVCRNHLTSRLHLTTMSPVFVHVPARMHSHHTDICACLSPAPTAGDSVTV